MSNSISSALELVAEDMQAVDALIARRLASDVPLVEQVSQYIILSGGKRLRPVLLLLMCKALGYQDAQRFNMAAIIEFIHTATLLHDDVVDESTLRRGKATANASFGNPASVLVGDFLYSRAFQMMVDSGKMRIMQILAEATNVIAEGEVLQLMNMHNAGLDKQAYLHVIRSKTAKLFEASTQLAAVLNDADAQLEAACAGYGRHIGTAFQIVDDVLDYAGNSQSMGKNLGDDLREGKVTLPLIVAMGRATDAQRALIAESIEAGGAVHLDEILGIIQDTDAISLALQCAHEEAQVAIQCLQTLPPSAGKQALLQLANSLLERKA